MNDFDLNREVNIQTLPLSIDTVELDADGPPAGASLVPRGVTRDLLGCESVAPDW